MSTAAQLPPVARSHNSRSKSKKNKKGVVYDDQHTVLKPVNNCASGRREVDFYNTIFQQHHHDNSNHSDHIAILKRFLPRYHGLEERAGVNHIKLENLLSCFKRPSMLDIKMGHVTSDPLAHPEKVAQRRSKYPHADKLGFALSGFSVYRPSSCEFESTDKYTCHNFTLQQIFVDGLGKFFGFPHNPRRDVIVCLLRKLEAIRQWFVSQRQYVFYASSLLIVYEGLVSGTPHDKTGSSQNKQEHIKSRHIKNELDSCHNTLEHSVDTKHEGREMADTELCLDELEDEENILVDVRLIDFTHAFPTQEQDDNYLSGLENLITVLKILQSWAC